jgi:hypothetical protein
MLGDAPLELLGGDAELATNQRGTPRFSDGDENPWLRADLQDFCRRPPSRGAIRLQGFVGGGGTGRGSRYQFQLRVRGRSLRPPSARDSWIDESGSIGGGRWHGIVVSPFVEPFGTSTTIVSATVAVCFSARGASYTTSNDSTA